MSEKKIFNMEMRAQIYELMGIMLRMYEKTKKERWLEEYKYYEQIINEFPL